MVRIPPIFYSFTPKVQENRQQAIDSSPVSQPVLQYPVAKGRLCTFLGDSSKFVSLDLSPVLDFGDIQCPCCGVKTLSEEKYESLLKDAEQIKTPKQMVKFFKANENYIPLNMRECIFRNSDKYLDAPEFTVLDYFHDSKQLAFHTRHYYIEQVDKFLIDYSKKLTDGELKTSVLDTSERLNPSGGYHDFKELMFALTSRQDFGQAEKCYFFDHLYKDVRSASLNFGIYAIHGTSEMSAGELAKLWAGKVFSNSLIKETKIHNYQMGKDVINNSVLVCNSCSKKSTPKVFMDLQGVTDYNEAKFLMFNYLSNISKLMGEGKITLNKFYFTNFAYYIDKLSKGNIKFTDADIDKLLRLRAMAYRRDSFTPIEQTEVDIPCACCGSTMLPHSKRLDIQLELIRATSLKDYADILQKYDKYIGHYAKDCKNIFLNIYNSNPQISEEDFIAEFTKRSKYVLDLEVDKALETYDKNIDYIKNNGTSKEYELMKIVKDRTLLYLDNGYFDDYNYSDYLATVFHDINLDSDFCSKGVYMLLNDMKTIAYKSLIITPNDKYDNSDKSPLFTLLFNIFKTDVATGDLLMPLKKGGSQSKDNIIGLCKGCNLIKSNKGVEAWYTQLLSIRKNFRKQLHVIDGIAKDGKLKGFDSWAKDIAVSMYSLTRGRYDIRDEF